MPSKFGGVPVNQPAKRSKFGGVPVDEPVLDSITVTPDRNDPQVREALAAQDYLRQAWESDEQIASDSPVANWLVGAMQGLRSPLQAVKQLGTEIGEDAGLVSPETAQRWRSEVIEDADQYGRTVGQTYAARAGHMTGSLLATAPLGVLRFAGNGYRAVAATGALQGGLAGMLTPTSGAGNFYAEKGGQAGLGAGLGGALGAGGKAVIDGAQAVANAPRKLANMVFAQQAPAPAAPVSQMQRIAAPSPASIRKGDQVAQATGVNFSPGQRTNSKPLIMAENVARGSIWTKNQMFLGDQKRARQLNNQIRSTARSMSSTATSPEQFATDLQTTVKKATEQVARERSAFGRQAYGAVEQAAGGAKIVQTQRTLDALAEVVDEYKNVQGADAQAVARQAEAFFNSLSGDGSVSAGQALRQMQAWEQAARTGSGLFEGVQNRSTAKTLAGKLARALQDDMDMAADSAGGSVGDLLRQANAGWKSYSQRIDTMEASTLGRLVGEDFADDVAGVSFNKVSPETVWKRLDTASPTELEALKQYVHKMNPELWAQYQRLTLERARGIARTSAPSMGDRTLGIDAGAFVRNMEGSTGQKAVDAQKRLQVIFGDDPRVANLLTAGRRMADVTGYNHSGTSGASEVMQIPGMLGKVAEGAKATAGALGPLYGLRTVAAKAAQPAAQRAIPLLEAPAWMRSLPNYGAPAVGAYSARRVNERGER